VGPVVVRRLRDVLRHGTSSSATVAAGLELVDRVDPTQLLELWEGATLAIVVDAVRCDRPRGSIVVHDLADPPASTTGVDRWATGGTHALGVLGAVALSRALGMLPPTVIAVGVVAGGVDLGADLSPQVSAAIDEAVLAVVGVLAQHGVEVDERVPPGGQDRDDAGEGGGVQGRAVVRVRAEVHQDDRPGPGRTQDPVAH
jgi:hydrogenase maturation protease